jgi:hypothetical protein
MDLRGQRFALDLSDDDDDDGDEIGLSSKLPSDAINSISSAFIRDIVENTATERPVTAPKLKSTTTGFPEHKKRTTVLALKQQRGSVRTRVIDSTRSPAAIASPSRQAPHQTNSSTLTQNGPSFDENERQRIDNENKQRLAAMSAEEIEEERQELLAGLNPSLIERLLKRANIDDGRGDTGIEPASTMDVGGDHVEAYGISEKIEDAIRAPSHLANVSRQPRL